jgi:mycoredoxin
MPEELQPAPITIFTTAACSDGLTVQARLMDLGVPFRLVNIDYEPEAEHFVRFINGGFRSIPTLMIGAGKSKIVLTEPSVAQLDDILRRTGYLPPTGAV